ncbi:hypothetical protein PIB30_090530 [Stylosanthes scabra]|uniref:Uncharacterized protein n=1 Tax=Stylosanthes scabra TaxID=79078 RepID=A0ABU6WSP0_9FABA|nr:hypothetical protein [Stylosanthes scabra]
MEEERRRREGGTASRVAARSGRRGRENEVIDAELLPVILLLAGFVLLSTAIFWSPKFAETTKDKFVRLFLCLEVTWFWLPVGFGSVPQFILPLFR